MNTRERFVKTLTGEKVDRIPFMKIFGITNAIHHHWENEYSGIGECIDEVLQFEGIYRGWGITKVNMDPSNMGVPVVLKETEEMIVHRRGDGTVEQIPKRGDYNRHTIEWPIKTMQDWEAYKEKYLDPNEPSRFPDDWNACVKEYRNRDYPLQLTHSGVYGFARERMGDENLAYAFYEAPELVHDMMEYYTDFAIKLWEKQVVDVEFDLIECWEDMASKNGSLISPNMFDEFMAPCYRRIAEFAREHSIKIILVDSDGFIEELTGSMLKAGVTALYPYEVLAGNDVSRVLDRYQEAGAIGGLRKEAMYEGKEAIDKEMTKARELIKKGRYIPGPDHFVLEMASFANYRYFMESLREVVMTTKPEI
jgi:uroporphyrinogen decarboxylase